MPKNESEKSPRPKRVAVLAENVYEDLEAWYPILRLREAGIEVRVIGPEKGVVYESKHGYALPSDMAIASAKASAFDGVVIPGGYAPDKMRRNKAMVKFVRDVFQQGGLVASICHGPWMMCEADILRGRRFTSVGAIKTDCINAGGTYEDKEVVVDGNLVTSRTPPDLPAMMRACLEFLNSKD
ncbi:MAG: protease [Candidatus Sumerlaeota bacterium]|nr:protease [Candidatus Sumerlaeota bacterium]